MCHGNMHRVCHSQMREYQMRLSVYPALIPAFLLLSLLISCADETPTAPHTPASVDTMVTPVEWISKPPFRLTAPLMPFMANQGDSIVIEWEVPDSSIYAVQMLVRAVGEWKWTHINWMELRWGRYAVSLSKLDRDQYRFALGTGDLKFVDSSAVVTIRRVYAKILEPQDGELLTDLDGHELRWTVSPPGGRVVVEWGFSGSESYYGRRIFNSADSVQPLAVFNLRLGSCYDFRIRGENDPRWSSTVRKIGYAALSLQSPKPGDVWYRFLPASIKAEVRLPSCIPGAADTRYEMSTDGGGTWMETGKEWLLTQRASTQAYARVRNAATGLSRVTGPFTIMDRSAPFFCPRVGQVIRYLVNHSTDRQDTVVQNTITISVESERLTSARTEYVCHVVIKEGTQVKNSFTGLIWLDNEARRNFSGDFAPYNTGTYPNVHDISENEISEHGHAGDHTFTYTLRREFGLTHYSDRLYIEGGRYDWVQSTYELLN